MTESGPSITPPTLPSRSASSSAAPAVGSPVIEPPIPESSGVESGIDDLAADAVDLSALAEDDSVELNDAPVVMGILNVTPDSFSDGGRFLDLDDAVVHARQMVADGADIIDIGGESTRPGAEAVSISVEMERVVPVVEAVSGLCRVSVDTRHPEVARAAVAAGATMINDVSASLSPVAAELGVGWVAMHMQGRPGTMQVEPSYIDVVAEVTGYLSRRAQVAAQQGVEEIWIDPGFGFGKTLDHNLELLANIDVLVATGWPVAIGTSRKSMLGDLIARSDGADEQAPVDDRLVGSVTTATYAMLRGVAMIRVHDVKAAKQAATVVAGER